MVAITAAVVLLLLAVSLLYFWREGGGGYVEAMSFSGITFCRFRSSLFLRVLVDGVDFLVAVCVSGNGYRQDGG